MPIKFRCNYCRQFLGISRAQAGGIVDCPTCGRSIRVPQLDGSLQPLPEPELNLQDAQLARALEELARLGSSDPQPVARQTQSDEELEEENELPQLIPEPIPIEVPIPPTPIAINPPMTDDEIAEPPPSATSSGQQDSKRHEQSLLAELASLAPADEPVPVETASKSEPEPQRRPIPIRSSMPRVALMVGIAFVAGMLISETEYRHQVEEDIKPFRDVLLGLFFITTGMLLNPHVIIQHPLMVGAFLIAPLVQKLMHGVK